MFPDLSKCAAKDCLNVPGVTLFRLAWHGTTSMPIYIRKVTARVMFNLEVAWDFPE